MYFSSKNHPPRCNADSDVLLPVKPEEVHPITLTSINAESARKATIKASRRRLEESVYINLIWR